MDQKFSGEQGKEVKSTVRYFPRHQHRPKVMTPEGREWVINYHLDEFPTNRFFYALPERWRNFVEQHMSWALSNGYFRAIKLSPPNY